MEQLTIIGSEDGRLILADESGQRFSLAVDDVLRSEVRSNGREQKPAPALSASPRDIQARIRAGLSAQETAELLSVDIDVVRKFETPVIAEREHIVDRALAVPVVIGSEFDPEENPTFGTALRAKLADLGASGERWTSWKDDSGWTVKLEFRANDVDHDARWQFEPRRSALAPANGDATQLSRQGPLPEGLIPRLRAVDADAVSPRTPTDAAPVAQPRRPAAQAPQPEEPRADTVDLLEALRRKRGQREAPPATDLDESAARHPAKGRPAAPVSLFDLVREDEPTGERDVAPTAPVGAVQHVNADERPAGGQDRAQPPREDVDQEPSDDDREDTQRKQDSRRRGRRAAMPSWDDIVFGARGDE